MQAQQKRTKRIKVLREENAGGYYRTRTWAQRRGMERMIVLTNT